MRIPLASLLLLAIACGGHPKSATTPDFLPVQDAVLPYRIVRAQDGREVARADFYAELQSSSAICVGESHSDSHHHWAQLEVLTHVTEATGDSWAMGMEMFQRSFQGVLDDFREGRIGEKELLSRSGWERRWSHDWRFYAPMVRLTVERGAALLALNISKELKEKWKETGLEGLSPEDKARMPELKLDDEVHRLWFRSLMEEMSEGHQGGEKQEQEDSADKPDAEPDFIDSIYPVQVLWDETMADTGSKWLKAAEGRQLVILAGNGHCHKSAIVGRMKRRGVSGVVSVRPVVDTGEGEVADLLGSPIHDYLFVMDASAAPSK